MFRYGDIIGSTRNKHYYWTIIGIDNNSYVFRNNDLPLHIYTCLKSDSIHLYLHKRINFTRFEMVINKS